MVKVKEWRQGLGVTQKALAEASGLDIRWIQKLEAGDIDIQNVTVKRFSLLLKGISELSQQTPCPLPIKADIEMVYGIHEMVDRLLEEESSRKRSSICNVRTAAGGKSFVSVFIELPFRAYMWRK